MTRLHSPIRAVWLTHTERKIVDSILVLSPANTILGHRLSSVKLCERVYLINSRQVIDIASFEVAARLPAFVNPASAVPLDVTKPAATRLANSLMKARRTSLINSGRQ